jgi:hypothetical protein
MTISALRTAFSIHTCNLSCFDCVIQTTIMFIPQGGVMKKHGCLIMSIVFCLHRWPIADDSEGLSQQAMESVAQQTREMSALGIPQAQAQKMLTQMVQNRFQKQNRIRAQEVVMAAAKAGLPTEPVMSKAMEGMAKQAKEQQVIAAMETVRSRYAYANQIGQIPVRRQKKHQHHDPGRCRQSGSRDEDRGHGGGDGPIAGPGPGPPADAQ